MTSSAHVTRQRHPLCGQLLQVLGQMRRNGHLQLLMVLPDGSKTLIPAGWTDFKCSEQSTSEVSGADQTATMVLGSLDDLTKARTLVNDLLAKQAAQQSSCKEDNHAAHSAQSDARSGAGASQLPDQPDSREPARENNVDSGNSDRQSSNSADGGMQ